MTTKCAEIPINAWERSPGFCQSLTNAPENCELKGHYKMLPKDSANKLAYVFKSKRWDYEYLCVKPMKSIADWDDSEEGRWYWIAEKAPFDKKIEDIDWRVDELSEKGCSKIGNHCRICHFYHPCDKPSGKLTKICIWWVSKKIKAVYYAQGDVIYRQLFHMHDEYEREEHSRWYKSGSTLTAMKMRTILGNDYNDDFVIENLLNTGDTCLISGDNKGENSHLAMQLYMAVQNGYKVMGLNGNSGEAVYVTCDLEKRVFNKLLKDCKEYYGLLDTGDCPVMDLCKKVCSGAIDIGKFADEIRQYKDAHPQLKLIVIDSLLMLYGGKDSELHKLIHDLRHIAVTYDVAIVYTLASDVRNGDAEDIAAGRDGNYTASEASEITIGIGHNEDGTVSVKASDGWGIHYTINCEVSKSTGCFTPIVDVTDAEDEDFEF